MVFRSNFGIEFRVSNNDRAEADIDSNRISGGWEIYHPFASRDAAIKLQREGEVAYNRGLLRDALDWVVDHPANFARLTALRVVYFWFPKTLKPAQSILLAVLTLAGSTGLYLLLGTDRSTSLLLITVWLSYPLVYYLLQSAVRYRYPLTWTFLLLASLAGQRINRG